MLRQDTLLVLKNLQTVTLLRQDMAFRFYKSLKKAFNAFKRLLICSIDVVWLKKQKHHF